MSMNYKNLHNEYINKEILCIKDISTKIYIVGGFVRDLILDKKSYDIDYIVKGQSAIDFARKVANKLNGYFVMLDEEHDIARVVLKDKKHTLDFAQCVGKDINEDLNSRDFTINSIAFELFDKKTELIDKNNAIDDLNNKIIRTVKENNLIDDPLRTLRAFRFLAQFDFEIEENTLFFINKHQKLIQNVSNERINQELIKMCEGNNTSKSLKVMKEIKFLDEIFPELTPQRKVPKNAHHHLGLIDHTIETVYQIEQKFNLLPGWAQEIILKEQAQGIKHLSLLKIAAILHDIGKPDTWTIEGEKHRFIKHEEVGSIASKAILKRLKFSNKAIKDITTLIKYHMYPTQILRTIASKEDLDEANLTETEIYKLTTDKTVLRCFKKIGDVLPQAILIAIADRYAAQGPDITEQDVINNQNGLLWLLDKYKEQLEKVNIPKLIRGDEIMEIFNIEKGPKVGEIVRAVRDAQMLDEISTKEEAVNFIREYLK